MAPPKWLVEFWKEEPDWIKRFQRGTELNAFLCKVPVYDKSHTLWTPQAIRSFKAHMTKMRQLAPEDMTLYRGTSKPSPTYQPLCETMTNCQFLSTSKKKSIAKEFGRKGFLHVFKLKKGVAIYDMKDTYGDDALKREQEVLIYPGAIFKLESLEGNELTWTVS